MYSNEPSSAQIVALNQPVSKAVYDYWNALRNGRATPRRGDVDPAGLRSVLPHVMLLERIRADEIVFRLAGTRICQAFGRELRDYAVQSLWDNSHRSLIGAALGASLKRAAPLLLRFRAHALGREPRDGEMMMLPLLDKTGGATLWLASFAFSRDPLGEKAFTRLELIRAEAVTPNRDRVELVTVTAGPPRARLTLVPKGAASRGLQARTTPSMTRPWAGLLQEFLPCDDA